MKSKQVWKNSLLIRYCYVRYDPIKIICFWNLRPTYFQNVVKNMFFFLHWFPEFLIYVNKIENKFWKVKKILNFKVMTKIFFLFLVAKAHEFTQGVTGYKTGPL